MLKIKDSVDLSVLDHFGFSYSNKLDLYYIDKSDLANSMVLSIASSDRLIRVDSHTTDECDLDITDYLWMLELLVDLTSANLICKI